jgi:lantibiotic modifying enzyme
MDQGVGWFTRLQTEKPITGLSHGAAGIAWALCESWRVLGDRRCLEVALDAVRYEHSQLEPNERNWIDPDDPLKKGEAKREGERALSLAWCYGAPGIGLGRVQMLRSLDDEALREDARIAVETTLERGFGRNHCLCHGDLGNLDFLLQASDVLGDARLRGAVDLIASCVVTSMEREGFVCGVPLGVDAPALLNGLAGIGYGLLRIALPERVPSVLALEPPRD